MPRTSFFNKPVLPGQIKYRLDKMPLSWHKRAQPNPTSPYRQLKRSEILGYTREYVDRGSSCWKLALSRYKYAMKGEKMMRHINRANHLQVNYTRTEAAAAEHGMSLLELRLGLSKGDVQLNNKMLAEIALYEPKTFESLVEIARQKLTRPREGLEAILRPDNPSILHKTGLIPNHSTFCTGLTRPDKVQEILPYVPRQSQIPPPIGWRITGQYPGKNLYRAERYHWFQRPKNMDLKFLRQPRQEGGETFPDNQQGKIFRSAWRKPLTDPKVYQKKPWWPVK